MRRVAGALVLAGAVLAPASSAADGAGVAPFDCVHGVCGFNALAADLRVAPCKHKSVLLAYERAGGATLVQCSSAAGSGDNLSYLFDRNRAQAGGVELAGTRLLKAGDLAEAAAVGVPDRFSPLPLCKPEPAAAAVGELLLIAKTPAAGSDASYCYRLLRVRSSPRGVVVQGDDGSSQAASAKLLAKWSPLTARLLPYVDTDAGSQAVPAAGPTARVSRAKAVLFDTPDSTAPTRMYLVGGDTVQILDTAKRSDGWLQVRYIGRTGRPIDRWIRASDLDSGAAASGPRMPGSASR